MNPYSTEQTETNFDEKNKQLPSAQSECSGMSNDRICDDAAKDMNPYSREHTVTTLDEKIKKLSSARSECSSMSIYRVHSHLRNVSSKAYDPEIVAIGPYHRHVHGDHLQIMEDHKGLYLDFLLKRKEMQSTDKFVAAIEGVESKARKCYAEPIKLNKTEFVQMLVLDGCFIIELVRKFNQPPDQGEGNDPIFQMDWIINSLMRDLLLFENQVPYFVLCDLYDLIEAPGQQRPRLADLLKDFFKNLCPPNSNITQVADNEIKHLLSLIRHCWITPKFKDKMESEESEERTSKKILQFIKSATSCRTRLDEMESEESEQRTSNRTRLDERKSKKILQFIKSATSCWTRIDERKSKKSEERLQFIKSATRLREANVNFVKNKDAQLLDIKFEDGVMKMVPLTVEDRTESLFRNLIAYEQYCYLDEFRYFSHYVKFLDCLIDSSKDVELLVRKKIIVNWLGDDEAVSKMVNKLNDSVTGPGDSFIYAETFEKVNKHCEDPRNKWMAKLRRDYFNSPWRIISVVAALVLLLLTVTQTVLTILQVVSP